IARDRSRDRLAIGVGGEDVDLLIPPVLEVDGAVEVQVAIEQAKLSADLVCDVRLCSVPKFFLDDRFRIEASCDRALGDGSVEVTVRGGKVRDYQPGREIAFAKVQVTPGCRSATEVRLGIVGVLLVLGISPLHRQSNSVSKVILDRCVSRPDLTIVES